MNPTSFPSYLKVWQQQQKQCEFLSIFPLIFSKWKLPADSTTLTNFFNDLLLWLSIKTQQVKIKQKEKKTKSPLLIKTGRRGKEREGVEFVDKGSLILFQEAASCMIKVATLCAW